MPPPVEKIAAALLSGLAGAAIGWGAQALTLGGRVAAIEQGQARIESTLYQLLHRQDNK